MRERKPVLLEVNYVYFGAFLGMLILTSLSCIFAKQNLSGSLFFFSLYAIGQAVLETSILVFLGWFVAKFLGKIAFMLYIGATFVLGILHIFDFLMERILDLSVWETLDFVFDESLSNFLLLLDASGIPLWAWGIFFLGIALLPLLGMLCYHLTHRITQKSPYFFRRESFLLTFICIPAARLFWDFSGSKVLHPDAYNEFIKSLPWKVTFLRPQSCELCLPASIHPSISESEIARSSMDHPKPVGQLPNIYFFVIESFRGDFVTQEITPHLVSFKESAFHFENGLSNANTTQVSWFSLFHSQYPFYWRQKNWTMGSTALHLLKQWGYQIRLYSSAELEYYGMDEMIFGKEHHLLASYKKFHNLGATWQTDAMALTELQKDLESDPSLQNNQVFIVFWDSTHFDYSWPKDQPAKFTPYAKEFAYFKTFQSKNNIEQIKNRYRNAVHYVDSLFGKFLTNLHDPKHAIVIVSGDHGEEFFDHGHLFHGSHLTHEQIHIPLFLRFGLNPGRKQLQHLIASQMDVFPSVIDYISGKDPSFLQGQSIFREWKWPYALSSRANASRVPYQFCLNNGRNKLIMQFAERHDVLHAKNLRILSFRGSKDEPYLDSRKNVNDSVRSQFGPGLDYLFHQN